MKNYYSTLFQCIMISALGSLIICCVFVFCDIIIQGCEKPVDDSNTYQVVYEVCYPNSVSRDTIITAGKPYLDSNRGTNSLSCKLKSGDRHVVRTSAPIKVVSVQKIDFCY